MQPPHRYLENPPDAQGIDSDICAQTDIRDTFIVLPFVTFATFCKNPRSLCFLLLFPRLSALKVLHAHIFMLRELITDYCSFPPVNEPLRDLRDL